MGTASVGGWTVYQPKAKLIPTFRGHADYGFSIEDIGIFKPKPEVYGLIERHFPDAGDGIGFVSSNSWDIAGAESAGLTTFWIQRSATEPQEELGFPADHIISAVTDLPALVAG